MSPLVGLPDDEALTERELHATVMLVLGAGFETTVNLLGNAVVARPPTATSGRPWRRPAGWDDAVEEVLRLDSPCRSPAARRRATRSPGARSPPALGSPCCWARPTATPASSPIPPGLRRHPRERPGSPGLLRRHPLLPGRRVGPARGRGRAAHPVRALPGAAGQPVAGAPGAADPAGIRAPARSRCADGACRRRSAGGDPELARLARSGCRGRRRARRPSRPRPSAEQDQQQNRPGPAAGRVVQRAEQDGPRPRPGSPRTAPPRPAGRRPAGWRCAAR